MKNWLCPYLEKEKGCISFVSLSMQLTKLSRTKCVQEFYYWICAIYKVILAPVKPSSPTGLWARNDICSRYWLLAWSFHQCNSRFGFIEVHKLLKHLKVVWPVLISWKATNLHIQDSFIVSFDFYFLTPKSEEWNQVRLYRWLLRSLHEPLLCRRLPQGLMIILAKV